MYRKNFLSLTGLFGMSMLLLLMCMFSSVAFAVDTAADIEKQIICSSSDTLHNMLSTFEKPHSFKLIDQSVPAGLSICQNVIEINGRLNVVYTKGSYIFLGRLYNTDGKEALTEQALDQHRTLGAEAYQELKELAQMKLGSGSKEVVLISDPECPFCNSYLDILRKSEPDLTIYFVFSPLSSHPFGQYMTYQVLCTEDGIKSLAEVDSIESFMTLEETYKTSFSKLSAMPKDKICEAFGDSYTKVQRILKQHGASGAVPKTVFKNGKYVSGRLPAKAFADKYDLIEASISDAETTK